jgi:hypothetical protein
MVYTPIYTVGRSPAFIPQTSDNAKGSEQKLCSVSPGETAAAVCHTTYHLGEPPGAAGPGPMVMTFESGPC